MQRQFTIELRVDFEDREKLNVLRQTLLQCARSAYATACMISDNRKTTHIAVFSDDFFSGFEQIALMEDIIKTGLDQINEAPGDSDSIDPELAKAFVDG